MAGGSLSLTGNTHGQDVLSFNPQITFFKKVYKRHTNFGIETVRQSNVIGDLNFGTNNTITIEKKGSLITDMHFEFTLPPAAGSGGKDTNGDDFTPDITTGCVDNYKNYARWVNGVGFAIINEIRLKFGSNTVDTHTGLWYDVWNELTDPNRKEWSLVGKYDEGERDDERDTDYSRYYVPLKFYFNRNPGLAIPIFLLNENELKIDVNLNPLASLLLYAPRDDEEAPALVVNNRSIENFRFYATYVFLEQYEESRISNSLPSEYVAETLDIHDNINTSNVSSLVFENPTKEIIWVLRHPDRIVAGNTTTNIPHQSKFDDDRIFPNDIFNYSRHGINTQLRYGTRDPFSTVKMTISTKDRFETTDATYFRTIQPYKYHSNVPGGINKNQKKQYIYVYSFALNPEDYQPSGSYNFSLNDDRVGLTFTGPTETTDANGVTFKGMDDYDLTIFVVRYEYFRFDVSGRVSVSALPAQSTFQEAREAAESAAARDAEATGQDVEEAVSNVRQQIRSAGQASRAGVKNEIRRRYGVEVPYIYDQSLGKKQWSGLQGDFFQNQKDADLGKESKRKKKDIF